MGVLKVNRAIYDKTYRQSENGRQIRAAYAQQYYQTMHGKLVAKKAQQNHRKTERGKINFQKGSQKYYRAHTDRICCRYTTRGFIIKGKLIRPKYCECCEQHNSYIETHHSDYSKPLKVMWLCKKCHYEQHNKVVVK